MTKEETKKLMAAIRAVYPAFYRDMDQDTLRVALELWAVGLADVSYRDAGDGLAVLIRRLKFPPTVAEVREAVLEAHPRSGAQARRCPVFKPPADALPQGSLRAGEALPPDAAHL